MSKAKLTAAQELIREKRYSEARSILTGLDHSTAKKWLEKLDQIAPETKKSTMGLKITLLLSVSGVIVVLLFALATFVLNSRNTVSQISQLPTLVIIPSATPSPTSSITFTPIPSPTITFTIQPTESPTPFFTETPSATPTSISSPTQRPTNEPVFGEFESPAPLGRTMIETSTLGDQMNVTVLEVIRGSVAYELATSELFMPSVPIVGQEYIAVRVRLEVSKADPNEVFPLYPYWHLTLRFEESGNDVWSENFIDLIEGYPPLVGEFLLFYLVRTDSSPLLYFHPNLIIDEQFGQRTSGSYLSVEQQ